MNSSRDIDRLCDAFEAAWKSGNRPSISDMLSNVEESQRNALLQQLIPLDVECRDRYETRPVAADYVDFGDEAVRIAAREIAALPSRPADHASESYLDAATVIGDLAEKNVEDNAGEISRALDGHHDADSIDQRSRRIGPYKLLQKLGEGGMGAVYMADQLEPVRRRVALKLIKSGMDSKQVVARFEAERQALAMMDHQNIAKVLDAGITDEGTPYFAMELVQGMPITKYCDREKLSIADRLKLFVQVCRALQHAHQKGVIHRDIKPTNVLVTQRDGVPVAKVIDFGLAKAMQSENRLTDKTLFTEIGQVCGTLEYMSPEQAEMNELGLDTRTDVYSLGVLLYELLTGSTPLGHERVIKSAFHRVLQMIITEEAPRPSRRLSESGDAITGISDQRRIEPRRLSGILKRELDWIALKSLEKDRNRRYDGAGSFADDVQHYLNGEVVVARPPSLGYRLRKTARKHKYAAATGVIIVSLLIAGILGTTWGMLNAARERSVAMLAKEQAVIARDAALQSEQAAVMAQEVSVESEKAAIASKDQAEATLARSNYFLAIARWEENRAGDAIKLLERVPPKYRQFEWYLARRQFEGSEFTCFGHEDQVTSVSFSPDGRRIVSGSSDHTVKLWDAETGEELRTLKGHSGGVTSVAFSPNGRRIVSGSDDQHLKLWDAETGEELKTLKGHSERLTSVSFSPDGRKIVSGSSDDTLKLWDAETGEELRTLKGDIYDVTSVSFSPDGRRILSGGQTNRPELWDVETGAKLTRLMNYIDNVNSVSFSPDGRRIVSGSGRRDNTLKLWDAETGEELKTLKGHTGGVASVSFSPDGRRILSGSSDNTLKLWDAETGEELRTLKGHSTWVNSVAFSPDGRRIVSGSRDNTLKLWNVDTGEELKTLNGHTAGVLSVTFSPDDRKIVSGSFDNTLKLWDAETGEELRTLKGHTGGVTSVAFSPDGRKIVSGSRDQTLRLWDAGTGEEVTTLEGHRGEVTSVTFSPDGRKILSGSGNGSIPGMNRSDDTLKLWNTETGEVLITLDGHNGGVAAVAFSPDGRRILSGGSWDKALILWDTETGEELKTFFGHSSRVTSISFSPDGRKIVSGNVDGTLKLWDVETGEEFGTLKGHSECVHSVSFSPDARRILSGSQDRTMKLWDVETGEELRTLRSHTDSIDSVSFSPSGLRFVSGSQDETVKLWGAEPNEQLRIIKSHTESGSRNGVANIGIVDLQYVQTPRVKASRQRWVRPNPAWHREQLRTAKSQNQWYAATFHTAWLLKIHPADGLAYEDLHDAFQRLLARNNGLQPPVAAVVSEMLLLPRGSEIPLLTDESAELVNERIYNLVREPMSGDATVVSEWHLKQMQHVCSRFPQGIYFNTLGVLQYRLGRYESAIAPLMKSLTLTPVELRLSGPHPSDLAFLALCHHQLQHSAQAAQFRDQLNRTVINSRWVLDPEVQMHLQEVQSAFDGPAAVKLVASVNEFNRESTFEGLVQHNWKFVPREEVASEFALDGENPHSGESSLRIKSKSVETVMSYQPIEVMPNSKYRLTGWIRTQIEDHARGNAGSDVGACFGIVDQVDTSDVLTGNTDWKQITWEFQTGDVTTIRIGPQVVDSHASPQGPKVEITAWFDDLVLEKVE